MVNKALAEKMKHRWNTCCSAGSHLFPTGWHKSEENMIARFEKYLNEIDFDNKTIIDYGCGGGYLGRYLFGNYNINRYIAFDISERSVLRTEENLQRYINKEVIIIEEDHDIRFVNYNPDVFCCFACIIHFPTQLYLDIFLENVNKCEAEYLILEIRDMHRGTAFKEIPYKTFKDGNRACITESCYLTDRLTNYILYEKTDSNKHPTNCQVLYFKKEKKCY